MEELLKLLIEETESEERSYWYQEGYEAEVSALYVLASVLKRVQYRLTEESK